MTILFVSDLHLEEERPDITELFLNLLSISPSHIKALFILGDFFESWIGDDNYSPYNQRIIEKLRSVTKTGLPIYFMHGNRDFLIGKRFLKATGCILLPEECVINLYGRPTLLMHGDTLCTKDKAYLRFRKKTRNWLFQKLILMKSLKNRRELAEKMRAASHDYTRTQASYIMDVTQTEVERLMHKHKVQHLIHGHTHREAIHHFELNEQKATRTVLGAWHTEGRILVCKPDGRQDLIGFNSTKSPLFCADDLEIGVPI